MRPLLRIAVLALGLAAADAWPQDARGGYLGAAIGQAYFKHTCDGAPAGVTCNSNDTAARLFAGYQLRPALALEVGFHALGTVAAQGNAAGSATQSAEISALDLAAVGSWPIANRFSLLGKLGVYSGKLAVDAAPAGTLRGWESRRTNELTYGLGAGYALTDHADFRLEWQHLGHLKTGNPPAIDIHLVSLGALYRF
jgi:OOP family OmpA-OmpF porin